MEYIGDVVWLCAFAILSWRRAEYGALLLVATTPAYLIRFSFGPLPVTFLEIEILLLASIVLVRHRHEIMRVLVFRERIEKALAVSIACLLISASVSVFVSPDLRAALGVWRAYFIEPIIFFTILLFVIKKPLQIWATFGALGVSGALIALIALGQVFAGFPIPPPWDAEVRATSLYPYPNAVGLFLAPIIPLVAAYAAKEQKMKRLGAIALCILLIAGIIAAKTIGALVALGVAGLIGGALWSTRSRQWTLRVLVSAILVILVAPSIYIPIHKKLFFQEWSGTVRQITWSETLPMLRDHWFTGVGLAGYQKTFEPYHNARAIEIFLYPHSIVLNFWSEMGLYGLASIIALTVCYFILVQCVRDKEQRALKFGLAGAMVVLLVHGSVDVPYFKNDLALMWWVLFACALILYRYTKLEYEK